MFFPGSALILGDGPEPSEKILESISEAQVGDVDSKASRNDSKTRASKGGDNDVIRVLLKDYHGEEMNMLYPHGIFLSFCF